MEVFESSDSAVFASTFVTGGLLLPDQIMSGIGYGRSAEAE